MKSMIDLVPSHRAQVKQLSAKQPNFPISFFIHHKTSVVEGLGGVLQNFDAWWNDPARLLDLIRLYGK